MKQFRTRTGGALLWGASPVVALTLFMAAPPSANDPSHSSVDVKVAVSPNKAGTKKKPQGVRIKAKATLSTPPQYERPIVQRLRVFITKDGLYNGDKFPKCSARTLNRRGPKACPKESIMGKAVVDAYADTVMTHPKITIVNGGNKRAYFYTVLTSPARVATAVEAKVTRLRGNAKYGYRVDATIPSSLQVVAGVPIQPVRIEGSGGRGDWLATTGCPKDHLWRGEGTAYYDNGGDSGVVRANVRCRN